MTRDFEARSYTADEQRVCDYLVSLSPHIGCGDDPIGFLIASHAALRPSHAALRPSRKALREVYEVCLTGAFYADYDESCRLLGVARRALEGV